MKAISAALAVVILSSFGQTPNADSVVGIWKVKSVEESGITGFWADEFSKIKGDIRFEFTRDEFKFRIKGEVIDRGSYALVGKGQIDIRLKGETLPIIYKQTDNELVVCGPTHKEGKRPTTFSPKSADGTGQCLWVLTRTK